MNHHSFQSPKKRRIDKKKKKSLDTPSTRSRRRGRIRYTAEKRGGRRELIWPEPVGEENLVRIGVRRRKKREKGEKDLYPCLQQGRKRKRKRKGRQSLLDSGEKRKKDEPLLLLSRYRAPRGGSGSVLGHSQKKKKDPLTSSLQSRSILTLRYPGKERKKKKEGKK